jgi:trans-2,3-dihydro-3-hydroxyanthranilate isomerase
MKFYIADVFSEGPYAGNPLAVLPDAGDIAAEEMQQIARAFNFSETTFVTGGDLTAGFDVRIFTPTRELPFAGHPTLGTAFVICEEVLEHGVGGMSLNLGVGSIPVTFDEEGVVWMRQHPPVFGEERDRDAVARGLGLTRDDIDEKYPARLVSTGLEFLLVPLKSLSALRTARLLDPHLAHGVFVFCPDGYERGQAISARMFAGGMGVAEDPATGSANGCLAGYLVEYRYFGGNRVEIRVGQGYEVGRPSQLYLRARKENGDRISVDVGGKVRIVADGTWRR